MRQSVIVPWATLSAAIARVAFGLTLLCAPALAASDLTGVWAADNGAIYYLRQIGGTVWWAGFDPDAFSSLRSKSNSFQRGLGSAQVFMGTIAGDILTGEWAEVPRQSGTTLEQGTLAVLLSRDSLGDVVRLQMQTQTGGITVANWTRSSVPTLPCTKTGGSRDAYCLFAKVLKNQTETFWGSHESLLDNLKPYKDNAVIFGTVSAGYSLGLSSGSGFSCSDFFKYNQIDGDLTFEITADRQNLDAQPGFWTNGWINDASVVQGKLNAWQDFVHSEIIMYGRGDTQCTTGEQVLLPGWAEAGANSTLVNGIPVGAGVAAGQVVVIQGQVLQLKVGSRVRVTGPLVLDCGHGAFSPCYETTNDPSNSDSENLEIHPVYSVDVLQDYTVQRSNSVDLTGLWAASDVGTYYVRQIGNTVWWLGLSSDQGLTFANVFRGTVQTGTVVARLPSNAVASTSTSASRLAATAAGPVVLFPVISGQWASVPLGSTQGDGQLAIAGTFCKNLSDSTAACDPSQPATAWNLFVTQTSSSPLFANPPSAQFQWQKLFDEQTISAPQIVAQAIYPIGTVDKDVEATTTVPVSNSGNAPLLIQISTTAFGLQFSPSTLTIAPGATGNIAVKWLAANSNSASNQVVDGVLRLATNDPSTPVATITLEITIRGGPAR